MVLLGGGTGVAVDVGAAGGVGAAAIGITDVESDGEPDMFAQWKSLR